MATTSTVISTIQAMAFKIHENREYLTQLDAAIGDGDHGINLDLGFQAAVRRLTTVADRDVGTILKTVGMTLLSTTGGAGGILYGTAFLRAAGMVSNQMRLTPSDFSTMLHAAIEGVKMRGRSTYGDKTMLDAMIPAHLALAAAEHAQAAFPAALEAALRAAEAGAERTKHLPACKGKAGSWAERGVGHVDPGAASFALLLSAVVQVCAQEAVLF